MSDTFRLKILTPSGLGIDETVTSVTLPTVDGQVGILPQHVRYSAVLGTGILSYTKGSTDASNNLVVSEGFCHFADEVLTVLADAVDEPGKIDIDAYRAQKADIQKQLQNLDYVDPAYKAAQAKLARVEAAEELVRH